MNRRVKRVAARACALATAIWIAGCGPSDRDRFPLAVIDVETGRVAEEWDAPPLLFEVALDGDRVFGVSGAQEVTRVGDAGGILWEILPDRVPREVIQLPGIGSGEKAIDRVEWNAYGALVVDSVLRRAVVSAPASSSILLLDLNTESIVASYSVALGIHGTAIDRARAIGYASSSDGVFSFDLVTGELTGDDICSDALSPASIGIASSSGQVFIVASSHEVCRHQPALGTSEIVEMNCRHSPLCYLAGSATYHPVGSAERFEIAAPGSNDVTYLDTSGAQGFDSAIAYAPHDIAITEDGMIEVLSAGLCRRVALSEHEGDISSVPNPSDVPITGDALGLAMTADARTVFVAQGDPDGPLGIDRWLESPGCSPPILKEEE